MSTTPSTGPATSPAVAKKIGAVTTVDESRLEGAAKKFEGAKTYTDYRKMFDEMGKSIDAVTVSTPDHTHFAVLRDGSLLAVAAPDRPPVRDVRIVLDWTRSAGLD